MTDAIGGGVADLLDRLRSVLAPMTPAEYDDVLGIVRGWSDARRGNLLQSCEDRGRALERAEASLAKTAAEHVLLREALVELYNETRWAHDGSPGASCAAEKASAVLDEVKPPAEA